jgi:hypothetical protein
LLELTGIMNSSPPPLLPTYVPGPRKTAVTGSPGLLQPWPRRPTDVATGPASGQTVREPFALLDVAHPADAGDVELDVSAVEGDADRGVVGAGVTPAGVEPDAAGPGVGGRWLLPLHAVARSSPTIVTTRRLLVIFVRPL